MGIQLNPSVATPPKSDRLMGSESPSGYNSATVEAHLPKGNDPAANILTTSSLRQRAPAKSSEPANTSSTYVLDSYEYTQSVVGR